MSPGLKGLTHCGLVMPYGSRDVGRHWQSNGLFPNPTKPLLQLMLTMIISGVLWHFPESKFVFSAQDSNPTASVKISPLILLPHLWGTIDLTPLLRDSHTEKSISLTQWGRVTYTCFGKLAIIDSDNDLSPGCRQVIIWTNAGILLIGP